MMMNNMRKQSLNPTRLELKTTTMIKAPKWKRQKKFQNSRLKSHRLPSTDSRMANQETVTES